MAIGDTIAQLPSSFGAGNTTFGPSIRARALISGERFTELDRKQSYFDCTNHDRKTYDFDGRPIPPGSPLSQPLLSSVETMPFYVPIKLRRPNAPYRLAKAIVKSFTNMLFGEIRWPSIVSSDEKTRDFAEGLAEAACLHERFLQARNLAGACGSVCLSWCFEDGKPKVEVHNAKNIFVSEWADRGELIPRIATELYKFQKDEWDEEKKRVVRAWYWYRRDWTPEADVFYQPIPFKDDRDPVWIVDQEQTVQHDDGFCHLHWVQNTPNPEGEDGLPDYDGHYEQLDELDAVNSVLTRGTKLNLDPTLALKLDPEMLMRGVKKGSDNALALGESGDAKYLELSGSSTEAGLKVIALLRSQILEVVQCVIADPDKIAAAGTSSVALKMMFAPMISVVDGMRGVWGKVIRRILEQMIATARKHWGETVIVTDDAGEETEVVQVISLPPKQITEPVLGDDGEPTGEDKTTEEEREPGEAETVELLWGPYFAPTPDDIQKGLAAYQAAAGAKPILDQQTAAELSAALLGRDPTEIWRRLQAQADKDADAAAQAAQQQAGMFGVPGIGGGDDDPAAPGGKPGGFPPKKGPPGAPGAPGGGKPPPKAPEPPEA